MRVGSLFSGIGGLDLGLERAGMEIVWQVEVDEWCTRVLERHWPHVARFRDARDCHGASVADAESRQQANQSGITHSEAVGRTRTRAGRRTSSRTTAEGVSVLGGAAARSTTANFLPYVDLICGGFPCQPVSHAGRRMGESDSRWLWPEFYRIICEVRPRWVLAENVVGLLSVDSGRLFGGILRDLAEAGYDAVWFVLSAADVGAPHLRERVFVVAHASGDGCGARPPGNLEHNGLQPTQRSSRQGEVPEEVAHAAGSRQGEGRPQEGRALRDETRGPQSDGRSTSLAHADAVRRGWGQDDEGATQAERDGAAGSGWWTTEPDVGRVAHGVPARVDRLRGLGNAVVPQVAEVIGRWIMTSRQGEN